MFDKVFIVAELSANHNGSLENAINTIKSAKRAGADAIKLQTFTPDSITLKSTNEDFLIKDSIWANQYLYDLYVKAQTPWEWHAKLFEVSKEVGLKCFSSPFDKNAVDFLEELNCPYYKIASLEITDIPLIEYIASKGKPIFISTGIAEKEDIDLAIKTCMKVGNKQVVLLKCTTSYPADVSEANLIMIKKYSEEYGVLTGLSDHTLGSTSAIMSVGYGAKVIEKHFTIDKRSDGLDTSFSADESEFKKLVISIREAEKAIGKISFNLSKSQIKNKYLSRSLYVCKDVQKGDVISEDNVKSVRPSYGLHPKYLPEIMGKKFNKKISSGTRMDLKFIEKK